MVNPSNRSTKISEELATILTDTDIDAVCFDAFGTIVEIADKKNVIRPLLWLADRQSRLAWKDRLMRGPLTAETLIQQGGLTSKDVIHDINDMIDKVSEEAASVTLRTKTALMWRTLRSAGKRIGVCSNLAAPYGPPMLSILPDRPDAVVFSYETGLVKPEAGIYHIVAERLETDAHRILFVGDHMAADVVGPRRMGMRSMGISEFERLF